MTPTFERFPELRPLLDALCEQRITAEQLQRLEELVLGNPQVEACYVQYLGMYADLTGYFATLPDTTETLRDRLTVKPATPPETAAASAKTPVSAGRARRQRQLVYAAGLAAAIAAGVLVVLLLPSRPRPSHHRPSPAVESAAEPVDITLAVLLRTKGAEWEDTAMPTRTGAALPPGRLRLKAGYAQIEFYSGATVVLEGPADFQLISATEAYCTVGKLWATVPPQAQGFTIGSPRLDLVDRGTEFGMQVNGKQTAEFQVFRGKVELYPAGSPRAPASRQELTTGNGLRLDGPAAVRHIHADQGAFVTAQGLAELTGREMRRRQNAWLADSAVLRRDDGLVLYFPFQAQQPWSRTLRDEAGRRLHPQDGAIVGCEWGTGRWDGKQGLEFKHVGDRVRFHVPGKFDALTLAVWARVDALPNRFNSLMMTDAWDEAAPHWHISQNGKIELGVQGVKGIGERVHYLTDPVVTPDRFGQWLHLGVVYDREAGFVSHYLDGRLVHQERIMLDVPLRLGNTELGNWNVASRRDNPIRNFVGCMDEFLLFSRGLNAQEIWQLYEQGRPPL
jgi:hypothetical protein